MLMNGQQQNFYLDNLNLDSDEMSWDRPERNPASANAAHGRTPTNTALGHAATARNITPDQPSSAQNPTAGHNPRTLGNRVATFPNNTPDNRISAFPDSAFGATISSSAEAVPQAVQSEIFTPASVAPPEPLNPALVTPPTISSQDTPETSPLPAVESVSNSHESAEVFAKNAEVELAQDGNIAGFYNKIRDYGEKE